MADADSDADRTHTFEELRPQLADDLHALMAEHQVALQKQFGEWMAGHNDKLAERIRRIVEKDVTWKTQVLASRRCSDSAGSLVSTSATPAAPDHSQDVVWKLRCGGSVHGSQSCLPLPRAGSSVEPMESDDSMLRKKTYKEYQDSKKHEAILCAQRSAHRSSMSSTIVNGDAPPPSGRDTARALVRSKVSNYLVSAVILVHITAMGFEVEMDASSAHVPVLVQTGCNVVFTFELLLRMCAEGSAFLTGAEKLWNLLDSGLVLVSVLEMSLEVFNRDLGRTFDSVMTLRVVRIVRIVRIARVVRVLRFFRPLRMLVHSIIATLRPLCYVIMLLGAIIYSCSLVFTEAAKQHQTGPEPTQLGRHFGSLTRSMLTLFKVVTNGISWELVYQPLSDIHWFYGCIFIAYIIFSTFAVLNVMTAQFCQYAMECAREDDEEVICEQLANKEFYVEKLRTLFQSLTGDDAEEVTLQTFERNINEERVAALFQSLDIKISDAWTLFRLLDETNDHLIDMTEFVEGCLQLKGPATAIDLKVLANEINWFDKRLENKLAQLATYQNDIMHRLRHAQVGQGVAAEAPVGQGVAAEAPAGKIIRAI